MIRIVADYVELEEIFEDMLGLCESIEEALDLLAVAALDGNNLAAAADFFNEDGMTTICLVDMGPSQECRFVTLERTITVRVV